MWPRSPQTLWSRAKADHLIEKMWLVPGLFSQAFHYPLSDQTSDVKERLYAVVHGALAKEFCTRFAVPTNQEIMTARDIRVLRRQPVRILFFEACRPADEAGNCRGDAAYYRL